MELKPKFSLGERRQLTKEERNCENFKNIINRIQDKSIIVTTKIGSSIVSSKLHNVKMQGTFFGCVLFDSSMGTEINFNTTDFLEVTDDTIIFRSGVDIKFTDLLVDRISKSNAFI